MPHTWTGAIPQASLTRFSTPLPLTVTQTRLAVLSDAGVLRNLQEPRLSNERGKTCELPQADTTLELTSLRREKEFGEIYLPEPGHAELSAPETVLIGFAIEQPNRRKNGNGALRQPAGRS